MRMFLNWSITAGPIVFDWWHVDSIAGLVLSVAICSLAAILYECINRKIAPLITDKRLSIGLYGMKVVLSVFMMLALMSFNGFIIMGIITGAMVGYAAFNQETATAIRTGDICTCY